MPRISSEALAAALYHVGPTPPEPPKDLGRKASALWREIAASRPSDWFNPANLRLLTRYCRTCVEAERWADKLEQSEVGSPESVILCKAVIAMNASIGTMGAKLRLTVQNQISRHSGKLTETGAGIDNDYLLGGSAVHRQ